MLEGFLNAIVTFHVGRNVKKAFSKYRAKNRRKEMPALSYWWKNVAYRPIKNDEIWLFRKRVKFWE